MKSLKIISGVVVCLVFLISVYLTGVNNRSEPRVLGDSVATASQSTTTDAASFGVGTTFKVLACGPGSLENINITLTSNSPLELYDGTTTAAHSGTPTTTLAIFKTTTVGSYKYSSQFRLGLIAAIPSTVGIASSTITFNGNPVCQ